MVGTAALYVHFPYCVSICPYCDFDRQATGFGSIPRYVAAVAADMRRQSRRRIHSIFFGGGTPSLMEPDQVATLCRAASDTFDVRADAEITLEANPGECESARLTGFRAAGVNRLSIGVQSLDDSTLEQLGRRHTAEEARTAVRSARAADFDNVSLDLMLGLAGMTTERWLATLVDAIALGPEHLSCYILTVDERVPMGRDVAGGRLILPDEGAVADQYEVTQRVLAAEGYEQYEISNWARPGRASRHNLTYWRDEPYVGVGAGAAGWVDGRRTKRTPSPARYMAALDRGTVDLVEDERPDLITRARDWLALGLRLRRGIDPEDFRQRFGSTLSQALEPALSDLIVGHRLETVEGFLRIPAASVLVTSEILLRLHGAMDAWTPPLGRSDWGSPSGGSVAQSEAEGPQLRTARGA